MNRDDILIEVDDRSDADDIHTALNLAAAASYKAASKAPHEALAKYHRANALRYDRLGKRFEDALYPDPEPDEYEPPLPKDDPDYSGRELLSIRAARVAS